MFEQIHPPSSVQTIVRNRQKDISFQCLNVMDDAEPSQQDAGHDGAALEEDTFDTVTKLQDELALLCENLFVGIGSLQRDAPPRSLQGEDVVAVQGQPAPGDVDASAAALGKNVSQSLAAVKACIDALPDDVTSRPGTRDDDGELERLMRENDALDGEMAQAIESAQNAIDKLGRLHGTIVEAIFKDSSPS